MTPELSITGRTTVSLIGDEKEKIMEELSLAEITKENIDKKEDKSAKSRNSALVSRLLRKCMYW